MFFAPLVAVALAAAAPSVLAQDYSAAHNVTPISGTWSSGSKQVVTGPGFANPANMTFTYPNVTGISYAFTDDGWYEVARYRFNSNGSLPNCITGVLNWHHGNYQLLANGSIVLNPLADGYQQIQDPCAAVSNFLEGYNDTELYLNWAILEDATAGPKLQLYQFDGSPLAPMYQVYSTANLLPEELLRNVTETVTSTDTDTTTGSLSLFAKNGASRSWTPASVTSAVSAVFAVGVASLFL